MRGILKGPYGRIILEKDPERFKNVFKDSVWEKGQSVHSLSSSSFNELSFGEKLKN